MMVEKNHRNAQSFIYVLVLIDLARILLFLLDANIFHVLGALDFNFNQSISHVLATAGLINQ